MLSVGFLPRYSFSFECVLLCSILARLAWTWYFQKMSDASNWFKMEHIKCLRTEQKNQMRKYWQYVCFLSKKNCLLFEITELIWMKLRTVLSMKYSKCKISDSPRTTQPLSICALNLNNLNLITLNLITLRNFGNYLDNFGKNTFIFLPLFLFFIKKRIQMQHLKMMWL